MTLFYQNCSLKPSPYEMSSLGKACESGLMDLYKKTYYPIFRTDCSHCHNNGPGIGRFANEDLATAFREFQGLGRATVEGNFLNPNHQPAYGTGPQNQPIVDQFRPQWEAAEAQAADGCGGEPSHAVTTKGISNPSPGTSFKTLHWNLATDALGANLAGQIQMNVSLDVRQAVDGGGTVVGYEFRNPSVALANSAAGFYHVKGMHVLLNGIELGDVTAYSLLEADVASTSSLNLAPGAAYALTVTSMMSVGDLFSVRFDEIVNASGQPIFDPAQSVPPPPSSSESQPPSSLVTFQDLSNDGSSLGVFAKNCVICHNSANSQAGFNLTDYGQAKALASLIQTRMNNAALPMPPSGLLPAAERDTVKTWIQNGAPER
jgi:mono/diheme cytochrome c family protein